jgi:hypothetical protein
MGTPASLASMPLFPPGLRWGKSIGARMTGEISHPKKYDRGPLLTRMGRQADSGPAGFSVMPPVSRRYTRMHKWARQC